MSTQDPQPDIVIDLSDLGLSDQELSEQELGDLDQDISDQSPEGPLNQRVARVTSERAPLNHKSLRQAVKDFWVYGVLHSSLHDELYIRSGGSHPEFLEPLWDLVYQHQNQADQTDQTVAQVAEIADIFSEMNQQMLILGEAGSGKTVTLISLADALLEQESETFQPTPVVFNLSSWTPEQPRFEKWLVQELVESYYMPLKVSQNWVANDELLLLLDGLDEVAPHHRDLCVRAINQFRATHPVGMALCCRAVEYEALDEELAMQGTVTISPLTAEQIASYIAAADPRLSKLGQALAIDPELAVLAKTPLLLTMMALLYLPEGSAARDPERLPHSDQNQTHQFLDRYIRHMFRLKPQFRYGYQTHGIKPYYSAPAKSLKWLQWLANKMTANDQTTFQIEHVGRVNFMRWFDRFLRRTIAWLIQAVYIGLMAWVFTLFGFGPIAGLLFGLIFGYVLRTESNISEYHSYNFWRDSIFFSKLGSANRRFFVVVVITALFWTGLFKLIGTAVVFLLILSLIFDLFINTGPALAQVRMAPNQDTRQSFKNGLIASGAIWVVTGIILGALYWLVFGQWDSVAKGVVQALALGLTGGLMVGFFRAIDHVVLRFLLALSGRAPYNYAQFLDYTASRLLLRKVGGGYIFINRIVQEHIAALSHEDIRRLTQGLASKTARKGNVK